MAIEHKKSAVHNRTSVLRVRALIANQSPRDICMFLPVPRPMCDPSIADELLVMPVPVREHRSVGRTDVVRMKALAAIAAS
jgi:FixJ family two-component response regulator